MSEELPFSGSAITHVDFLCGEPNIYAGEEVTSRLELIQCVSREINLRAS
jgi:hypothetical protein